jgi:prostaglandin-E synthase
MSTNTAPIKWAQRSDSLYITIALPDVKDETIELTDTELQFKGKSGDKDYEVNIKFFQKVDSADSTYKVLPRSVQMHVMKEKKSDDDKSDDDETFWPRLLEDKLLEKNQVKIDWDRYVDEDEEEEGFDTSNLEGGNAMAGGMPPGMGGMGGMPPGMEGMMGGMPGMGGMGGMPGMEGMGGMPGMGGAGGMPGMGGAGGMDMEALMKQMGAMGGMPGGEGGMPGMPGGDEADSDDDDEDDLPELEEANEGTKK